MCLAATAAQEVIMSLFSSLPTLLCSIVAEDASGYSRGPTGLKEEKGVKHASGILQLCFKYTSSRL